MKELNKFIIYKAIVVLCSFFVSSASVAATQDEPHVLVIGDSILSWNALFGSSMPQHLSQFVEGDVTSRAFPGTWFSDGASSLPGYDIEAQYTSGDWDVVVATGGGNDILSGCKCIKCTALINGLISDDLESGAIPALLTKMKEDNVKWVFMGYMGTPGRFSFTDKCAPEFELYEGRLKELAQKDDDFYFVNVRIHIPYGSLKYHGFDRIHPSMEGSKLLARLAAGMIGKARADAILNNTENVVQLSNE